jgi:DNA polymerase
MKKLTIDLESRSEVKLGDVGVYVYAAHRSTDIMCFAFKEDDKPAKIWVPNSFLMIAAKSDRYKELKKVLASKNDFLKAVRVADVIEAHNANFERTMWAIMRRKHLAPELKLSKLQCSAAKAAYYALPRELGKAGEAIGAGELKSAEGHKLMLKMCKPRRPTKKDTSKWNEKPDDMVDLCFYCIQDVEAEYCLSEALPDMPKSELDMWRLDQKINDRGIPVDVKAINTLIERIEDKTVEALDEILRLTSSVVGSPRQIAASIDWLDSQGVKLPNLQKATVEEALSKKLPERPKRFLEIRQTIGMSSVSKLAKMRDMAVYGRVQGTMLYLGAATGRWSGKGVQPHNYPRASFSEKDINKIVSLDAETADFLYGNPLQVGSKCLRGMIKAEKGNKLICADYSSIEGRLLAWLTGETHVLEAYEQDKPVYKMTAASVYSIPLARVTSDQRQIGKVCELALGYQGWLGAFHSMAKNYGVEIEDDEAKKIILAWRENRPRTVKYWERVELAAIKAIRERKPVKYGVVTFGVRGNFLHCKLPSGRLLSYSSPELKVTKTKYGVEKLGIRFMGVNSVTRKWGRDSTYGGKLTENIVQAMARDILAHALKKVDAAGYDVDFHVHDEIVAESSEKAPSLKDFIKVMLELPSWAEGLPMAADGWIGKRYRK